MAKLETQLDDETFTNVNTEEVVEFALDNGMSSIQFILEYLADGGTDKALVFEHLKEIVDSSRITLEEQDRYAEWE